MIKVGLSNLVVTIEDNGKQLFYVLIGFKVKHYMYTIKAPSVYKSTMLIPGKFKFVITVQDIGRV